MQSANDVLYYLNVIRKRFWLIILMFMVTEGVIWSITSNARPVYRATVRLQVLASDRSDVALFTQYGTGSTINEIQQAQIDFMRTLKSYFVTWQTIADLNLEIGAVDLLAGLDTAAEGDFVNVTVEADDPGRAERIAMAQVNNALAYYRNIRATPSRVLGEFVSEQLSKEEPAMLAAEKALIDFKRAHDLDSIEVETRSLQDLIRVLKLEKDRALIEQERADVFARTYRTEEKKANDAADEIAEQKRDGEEAAPNTLKFYLDLARQHEATAINYEAKRDGYVRSITIYDRMIDERTQELQSLLALYGEYNALEKTLTQAKDNYGFLWDRENEARLKQLQAEKLGYIQIIEPARKPERPVPSKLVQLLLVGAAVSVLAGLVFSFFLEFLGSVREAARRQPVR